MTLDDPAFPSVGEHKLEYLKIGPRPDAAPTIVISEFIARDLQANGWV